MRQNSMIRSVPPLWLLVLLALVLWGGEYIRRDLWAPDEARFALVSREMRDGHWLVPFRQGEFYSHKPPLMFWLTNLFSSLTGGDIGNVAPRLPSFLGAMMTLWAATRLAARWFSTRASWYTLLILPSSFLVWNKGGFGQIDMLLCGLEMMALYFLFTASDGAAIKRLVAAYLFMGLAVLAKGPVGFLVPWGIYWTATYFSGEQTKLPRFHWLWGPLISLSFPAIWLGLAWMQGAPEGFFQELLFKQNVGRVAGEFGGHRQPFYYFLYYFPLDFLPWTLLLPLSYTVLKRIPEADCSRYRLTAWILFTLVFFSLSASKRNLYILICYPAAAILVAGAVEHWRIASSRLLRNTYWSLWGFWLVLGVVMVIGSFLPQIPFAALTLLPGGLTLVAGCWIAHRFWKSRPQHPAWLITLASAMLINFASIGALVYPAVNDLKTPDEIIEPVQRLLAPDDRLVFFKAQEGEIYSLYAERIGVMTYDEAKLSSWLTSSGQSNQVIICPVGHLPEIKMLLDARYEAVHFTSGSKKMTYIPIEGPAILTH